MFKQVFLIASVLGLVLTIVGHMHETLAGSDADTRTVSIVESIDLLEKGDVAAQPIVNGKAGGIVWHALNGGCAHKLAASWRSPLERVDLNYELIRWDVVTGLLKPIPYAPAHPPPVRQS